MKCFVCTALLLLFSPLLASQTRTTAAATQLQTSYNQATGLYTGTGWWNSANAITALADLSLAEHSKTYLPSIENTFAQAPNKFPGFLNDYFDDEGWWALAWIRTYDITHDARYLSMADSIFQNMTTGWDETCGGGIWWSKQRTYKNAIANELFLSVAASLANRSRGDAKSIDRDWAIREWKWFQSTGMRNSHGLINDGLTKDCRNNQRNTWTYNQGVLLGGLAELSKLTHDKSLLTTANQLAATAIAKLSDSNGVLHDTCEPNCSADGIQFKGIFVRNLTSLPSNAAYTTFLQHNADTMWTSARSPDNAFDQRWSGPFVGSHAGMQSSALDLLLAAEIMARGKHANR